MVCSGSVWVINAIHLIQRKISGIKDPELIVHATYLFDQRIYR